MKNIILSIISILFLSSCITETLDLDSEENTTTEEKNKAPEQILTSPGFVIGEVNFNKTSLGYMTADMSLAESTDPLSYKIFAYANSFALDGTASYKFKVSKGKSGNTFNDFPFFYPNKTYTLIARVYNWDGSIVESSDVVDFTVPSLDVFPTSVPDVGYTIDGNSLTVSWLSKESDTSIVKYITYMVNITDQEEVLLAGNTGDYDALQTYEGLETSKTFDVTGLDGVYLYVFAYDDTGNKSLRRIAIPLAEGVQIKNFNHTY